MEADDLVILAILIPAFFIYLIVASFAIIITSSKAEVSADFLPLYILLRIYNKKFEEKEIVVLQIKDNKKEFIKRKLIFKENFEGDPYLRFFILKREGNKLIVLYPYIE